VSEKNPTASKAFRTKATRTRQAQSRHLLVKGRGARRQLLPDPDIIAAEIVEDLQAALAQFAEIANDLEK
jgi:hypothetical protein